MSLTLPLPNAHFIWYCAWLSVPSTIYALTCYTPISQSSPRLYGRHLLTIGGTLSAIHGGEHSISQLYSPA